jgi:hypothetical protein
MTVVKSSFLRVVTASLFGSHSLFRMGKFFPADIPCPLHELSRLKIDHILNPSSCQLHFLLIEYPAQSTQVHTFPCLRDRSLSVTSFLPDSPPIPAGDQLATPAVQYPLMLPGQVSNTRPRPAGFAAIPATARARRDPVNDMSAENMSGAREAREHVQRLNDNWIGDAKTVLTFVSLV